MILHLVAVLPSNRQKLILVHKMSRKTAAHVLTEEKHIQREVTRQCNLTRLLFMPRNLARADCTCKSQNESCNIVTILIGERLSVLSVRRSTFHPAECNSKARKPINCNVELWFVLDTCRTSSLRSTQQHIETQK